jgi:hypothetical protein
MDHPMMMKRTDDKTTRDGPPDDDETLIPDTTWPVSVNNYRHWPVNSLTPYKGSGRKKNSRPIDIQR